MLAWPKIHKTVKGRSIQKQRVARKQKIPVRSRLYILNRNGGGSCSTSLMLGLEPAVLPSRNDEVGPDEDITRKQHAKDELEE